MSETPDLADRAIFRFWSREVCRYGDTDRQGHVNNAAFVTFCETGRVHCSSTTTRRRLHPPAAGS